MRRTTAPILEAVNRSQTYQYQGEGGGRVGREKVLAYDGRWGDPKGSGKPYWEEGREQVCAVSHFEGRN